MTINLTSYSENKPIDALHYHENAHFSLVLRGGNVEKRKKLEFERVSGCVTFYHAEEAHQNIHKLFPALHINVELDNSFLKQHLLNEEKLCTGIQNNPDAAPAILKIYKEVQACDSYSVASVGMLIHSLTTTACISSHKPLWVNIIYELLHDQWNESVTLLDLSTAAGVHPVTISKYFPKYFHCTLGEYMRKLRVVKAIYLIKSSSLSLTEIAYQCGFSDQSHLTRTFQQLTGFAPKKFRQL